MLDFPGTITFAENLERARTSLASALVDMALTNLINGEPLPTPNSLLTDSEADIEEPIHLILTGASHVKVIPDLAVS